MLRPDMLKQTHDLMHQPAVDPKMVRELGCLLGGCMNHGPSKLLANQKEGWLWPQGHYNAIGWVFCQWMEPETWKALAFIRRMYMEQTVRQGFADFMRKAGPQKDKIQAAVDRLKAGGACDAAAVRAAQCALMHVGVSGAVAVRAMPCHEPRQCVYVRGRVCLRRSGSAGR